MMASARVLTLERLPIRRSDNWQDDAWGFYDGVGELRYAVTYVANALSRVRLVAATPGTPSNPTPTPIVAVDDVAVDLVARLAGGAIGQSGMLAAFGTLLTVPGISYLVGERTAQGETWNVYSADVIRDEGGIYKLQTDDASGWRELAPDSLVVQVWRPHRRYPWQPDSAVRGVLGTLEELDLLNKRIKADAISRLAGAGVLTVPAEAEFPTINRDGAVIEGIDALAEQLLEYFTTPIANRDSAAAVVPYLLKLPHAFVDGFKHFTFSTPFDEKLLDLREAAIKRLATGLDLPVEAVLGLGDTNHWSAWQISDEAIELHIDPLMETICEGLTTGYLAPSLAAAGSMPDEAVVWYDDSQLRTPPDQSGKAVEMYDRGELSGEAMRRESNFAETDRPEPAELRRQVIVKLALTRPDLIPTVLPYLDQLDNPVATLPPAAPQPGPSGPTAPGTPPPTPQGPIGAPNAPAAPTTGGPPAPSGPTAPPASARLPDALLAACDGLIIRALERAGNKLRARSPSRRLPSDCEAEQAHCCADPAVVASANMDDLLAGAWDRLPEVCDRYGQAHLPMRRWIDGYTRSLIASGQPHSYEMLSAAWGYSAV